MLLLQEINPENIMKVDASRMKEIMKKITDEGIRFSSIAQSNLLRWWCAKGLDVDDCRGFMKAVSPLTSSSQSSGFSVWEPALSDIKLTDMAKSELLLKCVVPDKLVPLVSAGESKASVVLELCTALPERIEPVEHLPNMVLPWLEHVSNYANEPQILQNPHSRDDYQLY